MGNQSHSITSPRASWKDPRITASRSTSGPASDRLFLRRDPDQWGRSFEFVVNGIPIFRQGRKCHSRSIASPRACKLQTIREYLLSARDANMNMIRVWGGGYYETDEFYQICDELGIMVWQDFMLADISERREPTHIKRILPARRTIRLGAFATIQASSYGAETTKPSLRGAGGGIASRLRFQSRCQQRCGKTT
jgi:hypothetical protein